MVAHLDASKVSSSHDASSFVVALIIITAICRSMHRHSHSMVTQQVIIATQSCSPGSCALNDSHYAGCSSDPATVATLATCWVHDQHLKQV